MYHIKKKTNKKQSDYITTAWLLELYPWQHKEYPSTCGTIVCTLQYNTLFVIDCKFVYMCDIAFLFLQDVRYRRYLETVS